jgi:hypothetical protein
MTYAGACSQNHLHLGIRAVSTELLPATSPVGTSQVATDGAYPAATAPPTSAPRCRSTGASSAKWCSRVAMPMWVHSTTARPPTAAMGQTRPSRAIGDMPPIPSITAVMLRRHERQKSAKLGHSVEGCPAHFCSMCRRSGLRRDRPLHRRKIGDGAHPVR